LTDSTVSDPVSDPKAGTAGRLIQAATLEFNEYGFLGTDTNRIARRAGFAPQTFYRWFRDKIDIFIRVYEEWQRQEGHVLGKLLADNAADARLVQACVAHHRAFLVFRRSLRQLSLEDDRVRAARAASRLRQIEFLTTLHKEPRDPSRLAVVLLQFERITDALAEGEIADMGLDPEAAETALAALIHELRS
jgi:AcrR family transcriptional regulator